MAKSEWKERWREGRIGFHQGDTNVHLLRNLPRYPDGRVLVPLAGKSRDMAFLASSGYDVVGVEFVEQAAVAFFEENEIKFERRGREMVGGRVRIIVADFFDVTPEDVGPVAWVFDRAALIAMPADRHAAYVEHLSGFSDRVLLVSLDYDRSKMGGPPYAVKDKEIRALFQGRTLEMVADEEILDQLPRFRERGLDWLRESVYLINAH